VSSDPSRPGSVQPYEPSRDCEGADVAAYEPSRDCEGADVAAYEPSRDREGADLAAYEPSRDREGADLAAYEPSRDREGADVAARRSESVTAATDSSAVVDESPVAAGLRTGRGSRPTAQEQWYAPIRAATVRERSVMSAGPFPDGHGSVLRISAAMVKTQRIAAKEPLHSIACMRMLF
jgi:hypothetical protein